ncbi:hypothetical protein [Wolbachia endosymbiont (group B) of Ennomos erosarius]|uniref:hypothetical protein n=1 Tax=Wolbachia endosymbiont (group B) of Ennomos erosarius TaxID=3066175 RepID=UPI003132D24F
MVNLICFFITAEFTLFSCLFYSPLIQNSRFRNKSEVNREKELLIKCYLLNKFTDIGMAKFEIIT